MSESQPISQLSLMKISSSTTSKCIVFCEVDSSLGRYELSLDDATTVETIIQETLRLVHKDFLAGVPKPSVEQCELFACRKSGRKVSDLPSLERQQTAINTGIKCFYLAGLQVSDRKRDNINSVSTKSIQSEMNALKPKSKEVKAPKRIGCFCFAWSLFSLFFFSPLPNSNNPKLFIFPSLTLCYRHIIT